MKARCSVAILLLVLGAVPAFAGPHKMLPKPVEKARWSFTETGGASWYGHWHNGMTTADGSAFDPDDFTARIAA